MSTRAERFRYRGHSLEELQDLSIDEVAQLLPARRRRNLMRAGFWTHRRKIVLEKLRRSAEAAKEGERIVVKTHERSFPVIPEVIGAFVAVHNGSVFTEFKIIPDMLGHTIGEFAPSTKIVRHGAPGIGATRSSLYVPLK